MSDRTGELVAVMETLADWLDGQQEARSIYDEDEYDELTAAVWQILELVQVLMAEYDQTRRVVEGYLSTVRHATNLIKDNAGPASKLIR